MMRRGRKHLHPQVKDPPTLQRGEHKTFQSTRLSNLTISVWKDTKEVCFGSTLSDPKITTNMHRRVGCCHVQVNTPGVSVTYGRYMSGVDLLDKMVSKKYYANLGHGSKKLWRHLLWYIVNLCIANSWVIYKMVSKWQCPKGYDHMAYRVELAEQLIDGLALRRRSMTHKRITDANIVDNLLSHKLICGHQKQPKRYIPHKIYKPNQKNHKEDCLHLCAM